MAEVSRYALLFDSHFELVKDGLHDGVSYELLA